MINVVIWILIATSNGHRNQGTTTVIDRYPDKANCEFVKRQLPSNNTLYTCAVERVVVFNKER